MLHLSSCIKRRLRSAPNVSKVHCFALEICANASGRIAFVFPKWSCRKTGSLFQATRVATDRDMGRFRNLSIHCCRLSSEPSCPEALKESVLFCGSPGWTSPFSGSAPYCRLGAMTQARTASILGQYRDGTKTTSARAQALSKRWRTDSASSSRPCARKLSKRP